MTITMIAAMANNRAIGFENGLPWRLPADMAYFVRMTTGKTVLMGRKTFESFGGKPLRNRRNVVFTRQENAFFEGCETVNSVEEALRRYRDEEELMIIGGGEIYRLFMPYADKLLLTEIDLDVQNADSYFPEVNPGQWALTNSVQGVLDERNRYRHVFQTYTRIG
ncbi:dihydrofolate reductase [Paenibacillus thailandensis]|uniref:Dihydrofolate reductase n=1 Tax=Paenibacillus thailandensis TaxID=393250 RepID=A0ABW5QTJ4_9BACL